ncbi:N-6 DNA methylase [Streptomyces sp. NL15-2K]|uniref:methylation-associated defense system DNA methyltransferase MAD2 n=1 Tax=Streptomyces sp. NL15-2K TaxID=376149 RepID=UPI000F584D75|nr:MULTISPECIES: N-6 DNA methylase [Actinomycetes]WKX12044.1 N-6 DNA methylase [Kutzneria buriramensis]GCB46466.1 type I restriction-modification system [Streptomyces sp. NL15-2K]
MGEEQLGFDIPGEDGRRPAQSAKARSQASGRGRAQKAQEETSGPRKLQDDEIFDYISGDKVVKHTPMEEVRQRIARALVHQYGIDPRDMRADFPLQVENRKTGRKSRKRASIVIFKHGSIEPDAEPRPEDIRRIVVIKPPRNDSRTVSKIRTFARAKEQVDEVADLMHAAGPQCEYGMWTDDKDLYFIHRKRHRFEDEYLPLANWPRGDASLFDPKGNISSLGIMKSADETMLKFAFRRCHDFIHGNEGLPKDAAFWQFLYVLFAKLHDEELVREQGRDPRFYIDHTELAALAESDEGSKAVADRVRDLFKEVKEAHADENQFTEYDRLTLNDAALTFITGELSTYRLHGTSLDALGAAYQELVGENLRGDRGQYFTPNVATRFMVELLDPQRDETVLDPCCGTGGFLRETLLHVLHRDGLPDFGRGLSVQEKAELETAYRPKLAKYARERVFGLDFDPFLTRAASFGVMMMTKAKGNTFQVDSLRFPYAGTDKPGFGPAKEHEDRIGIGKVHVLITNPPFGTDIPVTGPTLDLFRVDEYSRVKDASIAYDWSKDKEKGDGSLKRGKPASSVPPERLFVQKCVEWVRPGGRIGIVLPNGILSNPGPDDEAVRRYILDECWVMASVELPVEPFVFGAGVNILTTMLFLRKKTKAEKEEEREYGPTDYPVFMSVVEKVGHDRRGNRLYVRDARGEYEWREYLENDDIWVGDVVVPRKIKRRKRILDNDLLALRDRPEKDVEVRANVIDAYHEFLKKHGHELPWLKGESA